MYDQINNARKNSKRMYGFLDEFGNFGFDFDKEHVSSHFIVTAVLVREDHIDELEIQVNKLRDTYFPKGEIKSSKLAKNDKKRFSLVRKLCELDFKFVSLIIDKRKIFESSGLRYKDSFVKYLNGLLYKELYNTFPKLQLVADQYGTEDYMKRFSEYVSERNIPNLFEEYEFGFDNSKDNTLIQIADVICGLLALGFDQTKKTVEFSKYYEMIKPHEITLQMWPPSNDNYIHIFDKQNQGKFDENILIQSLKLVDNYITKNKKEENHEIRERVYVLNYMKSMLISQEVNKYVYSYDIIDNLKYLMKKDISKDHLRRSIIAKLRDEGVLISSSHSGYKIPVNEKEINDYINQSNNMIKPLLDRIKICRDKIKLATLGELDILDQEEFLNLKMFMDNSNWHLCNITSVQKFIGKRYAEIVWIKHLFVSIIQWDYRVIF